MLSSVLPEETSLETLKVFASPECWQNTPEQAAIFALRRCGKFDTADYLDRYPDVKESGLDPVQHFIEYGIAEKRYFVCLQDVNIESSKVKAAYKFFRQGEYAKSLSLYEELADQMESKNFSANIALCKKRLGDKTDIESLANEVSRERPKVSVLIPVYNNAQYLHECIDSVINQTLKEIEIIIINDGSTDPEAVKILDEYAAKDNRIKLIHKENTGYGHSMNVGMDNATGEYIGIVESDDYITTTMYNDLYMNSDNGSADIIKSTPVFFYGNGKERRFTKINSCRTESGYIVTKKDFHAYFRSIPLNPIGIFKKSFLKKEEIFFSETPGASFQDIGFYFKTSITAKKIKIVNKEYYMVRRDNENSSVFSKDKSEYVVFEYKNIYNFLKKK